MKNMKVNTSETNKTRWHELLGDMLEKLLVPVGISVFTDVAIMSRSPEADILLLRKETAAWTPEQRERLADGIRDTKAGHILIEFKYTESVNEYALRQNIGYDHFYKKAHRLSEKDVQTILVSSRSPGKEFLHQCGYTETAHAGVYRSSHPVIKAVRILSLNELSDELHNAYFKCFASRKQQKHSAFGILKRRVFSFLDGQIQRVLMGLVYWFDMKGYEITGGDDMQLTPEIIRETGRQVIEFARAGMTVEERLAGLKPEEIFARFKPEERLAGLKPEEIFARFKPEEIEAYLKKIKRKRRRSVS